MLNHLILVTQKKKKKFYESKKKKKGNKSYISLALLIYFSQLYFFHKFYTKN